MKWIFIALLTFCLPAFAQSPRSKELTDRYLKWHSPIKRVIGQQTYDLTPLVQWMHLDGPVKNATPRPYQFANWFEVKAGSWSTTNGWTVGIGPKNNYVAVRNLRQTTNVPPALLLYKLPTDVNVLYGAALVRAAAYDFGLPGR